MSTGTCSPGSYVKFDTSRGSSHDTTKNIVRVMLSEKCFSNYRDKGDYYGSCLLPGKALYRKSSCDTFFDTYVALLYGQVTL